MSPELISILVLGLIFVIATLLPVNIGVLAFAGAFLVGTLVADQSTDDIIAGFPSDLFLTLVGITYLFALAQNNGTVDWLVELAVRAVRGRIGAMPWIMFALAAMLTAVGAVSPGAWPHRPDRARLRGPYQISPLLMGLMVIHGAQAEASPDQHLRRHHHGSSRRLGAPNEVAPSWPACSPTWRWRAAVHGPRRPRPAPPPGRGDRGPRATPPTPPRPAVRDGRTVPERTAASWRARPAGGTGLRRRRDGSPQRERSWSAAPGGA